MVGIKKVMILNIKLVNFLPNKKFTVGILFDIIIYLFIFEIFDFYNVTIWKKSNSMSGSTIFLSLIITVTASLLW